MATFFAEISSVPLPSNLQVNHSPALKVSLKRGYFPSRQSGGLIPTIRRRVKIYCRIGFSLAVTANNTVRGVDEAYCTNTSRCKFKVL